MDRLTYGKQDRTMVEYLNKSQKKINELVDEINDIDNKVINEVQNKIEDGTINNIIENEVSEKVEEINIELNKLNENIVNVNDNLENTENTLENNINTLENETNDKIEILKNNEIWVNNPPNNLDKIEFNGTDESDKLQSIINHIVSLGGGTIRIPKGVITLEKPIELPLGSHTINIIGENSDVYNGTIFLSKHNGTILNIEGYNHTIKNISFRNSIGTGARGADSVGIGIYILPSENEQDCDNLLIENCTFFRLQYGILNKSQNIKINNNMFSYIKSSCFQSIGKTTTTETGNEGQDYSNRDIVITNNRFHACKGNAIQFNFKQYHKEVLIANNLIDDVATGIIGMLIRSTISNNVMGRIRENGIYIDNDRNVETITISNNTIVGISGFNDGTVSLPPTNSLVYEVGSGIAISSRNASIVGNSISYKNGCGILINQYSEYTTVLGNTLIDCGNYNTNEYSAINILSDIVLVQGNVVRRTTNTGKHLYSLRTNGKSSVIGDNTNNILGTCASGTPYYTS